MKGFIFQWKDKSYFVESDKQKRTNKDAEILLKLWAVIENVEIDWDNKTKYKNTVEWIKERMILVKVKMMVTDNGLEYWKYSSDYCNGTEYKESFFYRIKEEV